MIKNTVGQYSQDDIEFYSESSEITDIDYNYQPVMVSSKPIYSIPMKLVRMAVLVLALYVVSTFLLPGLMDVLDRNEVFSFESYSLAVVASTLCSVFLFGFAINTFDCELVVSESHASENEFAGKLKSENL
ncbi:hypothetical protein REH81_05450 [Vibrio rotiferianus]